MTAGRVVTRGTVVIDVEACKGCDLCIDACKPGVLVMTRHERNTRGYLYPQLLAGCTACQACAQICPDFVFQVWKYDEPIELSTGGSGQAEVRVMTRRLMEGSQAIAEAMVAADCRFFSGYPMTPFTEVLEHMARLLPEVSGSCINAESELEAVGMAWGAAAAGLRAATGSVGQGLSLMQESLSELCFARVPVVVLNMARGQGDYFQSTHGGGHGDYRHIVLAPSDIPEAVRLVQLAFHLSDIWRNPVLFVGDYYLAHVQVAVDPAAVDFGPVPAKDWAVTGTTGGTGHATLVSPLSHSKSNDHDPDGYGGHLARIADHVAAMAAGVEPMVETQFMDGAELVVVAYGTPAHYLRYVVGQLRAEGLPIGFVRPITLWPFPTDAVARAAEGARAVAVYELNSGQMIDDVRLAVLGRAPVQFIGGISFDGSGFGIAPDLDVRVLSGRVRAALDRAGKEVA